MTCFLHRCQSTMSILANTNIEVMNWRIYSYYTDQPQPSQMIKTKKYSTNLSINTFIPSQLKFIFIISYLYAALAHRLVQDPHSRSRLQRCFLNISAHLNITTMILITFRILLSIIMVLNYSTVSSLIFMFFGVIKSAQ